jgi:hypothetical protein
MAWPPVGPRAFGRLLFVWPALAVFTWLQLFALGIEIARLLIPSSWIVVPKGGEGTSVKGIGCVTAVIVSIGTIAARAVFGAV